MYNSFIQTFDMRIQYEDPDTISKNLQLDPKKDWDESLRGMAGWDIGIEKN
jgi:hypothetical protein